MPLQHRIRKWSSQIDQISLVFRRQNGGAAAIAMPNTINRRNFVCFFI
jgi:hypothetical protein